MALKMINAQKQSQKASKLLKMHIENKAKKRRRDFYMFNLTNFCKKIKKHGSFF